GRPCRQPLPLLPDETGPPHRRAADLPRGDPPDAARPRVARRPGPRPAHLRAPGALPRRARHDRLLLRLSHRVARARAARARPAGPHPTSPPTPGPPWTAAPPPPSPPTTTAPEAPPPAAPGPRLAWGIGGHGVGSIRPTGSPAAAWPSRSPRACCSRARRA